MIISPRSFIASSTTEEFELSLQSRLNTDFDVIEIDKYCYLQMLFHLRFSEA